MRCAIITSALLLAMLLPGCATTSGVVVTDSFCLSAKKKKWSLDDTPDSIRDARVWNQIVDRRCGVTKGAAA